MTGIDLPILVALALFGLAGGVGITALGPGGVLPTIGLFALTGLAPDVIAGTGIVTHVATGLLATGAFVHSGELRDRSAVRLAGLLAAAAVLGTPLGVYVNTLVSERVFGALLGAIVMLVAGLVWYREHRPGRTASTRPSTPAVLAVGFSVAVASGIIGLGGPMLSVPLLIVLGAPILPALAAAQAQSIVIAGVGTIGYVAHGSVDWPLAALIGVPELAGVLIGWVVARRIPTRVLKNALVVALLAVGPYLAVRG